MESSLIIRTMAPKGATQDLLLVEMVPVLARQGVRLEIDNAAGEDGIRAARLVARDPADGLHLVMTHTYTINYYPRVRDVGYTAADFDPLVGVGGYNWVVLGRTDGSPDTLAGVIARCKAEGRAMRHVGVGEVDALMVSAIARRHGVAVEFTGANGPALLETLTSGRADVATGTGTHQPLLAAGTVRVLALLHPRIDTTPGAPPGLPALGLDVAIDNFVLVCAPRGLAPDVRSRVVNDLRRCFEDPGIQAFVRDRLLMAPGLLVQPELNAVLENQWTSLAKLRALAA